MLILSLKDVIAHDEQGPNTFWRHPKYADHAKTGTQNTQGGILHILNNYTAVYAQ